MSHRAKFLYEGEKNRGKIYFCFVVHVLVFKCIILRFLSNSVDSQSNVYNRIYLRLIKVILTTSSKMNKNYKTQSKWNQSANTKLSFFLTNFLFQFYFHDQKHKSSSISAFIALSSTDNQFNSTFKL